MNNEEFRKRFKIKRFEQCEPFGEFSRRVGSWLTQYMNDKYFYFVDIQYIQVDKRNDLWNCLITYYELTE